MATHGNQIKGTLISLSYPEKPISTTEDDLDPDLVSSNAKDVILEKYGQNKRRVSLTRKVTTYGKPTEIKILEDVFAFDRKGIRAKYTFRDPVKELTNGVPEVQCSDETLQERLEEAFRKLPSNTPARTKVKLVYDSLLAYTTQN
jgi:hypothetical protein